MKRVNTLNVKLPWVSTCENAVIGSRPLTRSTVFPPSEMTRPVNCGDEPVPELDELDELDDELDELDELELELELKACGETVGLNTPNSAALP